MTEHNHKDLSEYHPACDGCILDPKRQSLPVAAHYTGYVNLFRDPQTGLSFSVEGWGGTEERVGLRIANGTEQSGQFKLTKHGARLLAEQLLKYAGTEA